MARTQHDNHQGGPGSSHENARKGGPAVTGTREPGGQHKVAANTPNPDNSRVSGGGGERDRHHTHNPATKA